MDKLPIKSNQSFYVNCTNYLKNLEVAYVDRFIPYFLCSALAHEFNKYNTNYEIWLSHGKVVNSRLHVLFVAPPGFMKTFASEILMFGKNTIFGDSVIPCDYQGSMCLPAGTKISLCDGSLKNIEEIVKGENIFAIDNNLEFQQKLVKGTLRQFNKPLMKLQLEGGFSLTATPNHPVLTKGGWVEIQNLKQTDRVAVVQHLPVKSNIDFNIDKVRLLGLMLADGCFRNNTICLPNTSLRMKVEKICNRLGLALTLTSHNPPIEYRLKYKGSGYPNFIIGWWNELDLRNKTYENKFIPDFVFKLPNKHTKEFIRFLFLGDGYISSSEIMLANKSEQIIKGTQHLLRRWGIFSQIYHYTEPCNIWKLKIQDKTNKERFLNNIWDTKTKISKPHTKIQEEGDIRWLKINGLHTQKPNDVYNLSVEELPNFVANGIVTHNTEASFTGTVRVVGDELIKQYGIAKTKSEYVLAIEEFSALTDMMKQSHSTLLDTALLTALDSGRLNKGLGLGSFSYRTNLTLWVSTQPARFDLTSGMGRRFLTLLFLPTVRDQQIIKAAMRKGENIHPNKEHLTIIKNQMQEIVNNIQHIESITFDNSVLNLFDSQNIIFYIEVLYKRLALGHHLITRWDGRPNIVITADDNLEKLLTQLTAWRYSIMQGSEEAQVLKIVQEAPGIELGEIKLKLSAYGYTYAKSSVLIDQLIRQREIRSQKIETGGRPHFKLFLTNY